MYLDLHAPFVLLSSLSWQQCLSQATPGHICIFSRFSKVYSLAGLTSVVTAESWSSSAWSCAVSCSNSSSSGAMSSSLAAVSGILLTIL